MKNVQLIDYLPDPNTIKGGLNEVVEIMTREAPLICDEIIRWGIFKSAVPFGIGTLLFIITIIPHIKDIPTIKNGDVADGCRFVALFCTAISVVIMILNTAWIKVVVAPKLYLLEYISNLIG